ncbi:MAG: 3-deoxy-D-manno-octulosonic acid transferase [Candidatus Porifericomitaceae bacterium WSBS_2022_MAG_OTU9]
MLRVLYSVLLYLLLPLAVLRLCYRCLRERDFSSLHLAERLGFYPVLQPAPRIVLHAVSLGEMNSAEPLLQKLRTSCPSHDIILTTTTPTGLRRGREMLAGNFFCATLPYDLPDATARFLARTKPTLMVIMENEIWPNLLTACAKRGIAVAIVNARLSPRSIVGYRRWRLLFAPVLGQLKLLAAQDEMAAMAWRELGVANVKVCGNLKYDALPQETELRQRAQAVASSLQITANPVWIAASTHPGEEEHVLAACLLLRQTHPGSLLIWAPRHPWRGKAIVELCSRHGLRVVQRSSNNSASGADIFLLDTLGELQLFYAMAQVAFVGGSLTATGGHNVLEPAALGIPVVCGPHTFNFSNVCKDMELSDAMIRVYDGNSLAGEVQKILAESNLRQNMAERARSYIASRSGASKVICDELCRLLPPCK